MKSIRLFLAMFIAAAVLASAAGVDARRTSKDVKRDKQKTARQIQQTQKQIAENDRETSRQLSRLQSIRAAIALRADTIAEIEARLDSVMTQIGIMNDSIARLEARTTALKNNYARTLRTLRERRQGMSDISFIFSSESFAQAWRRMRYLNEIAKSSTKQAKMLANAREDARVARENLENLQHLHAQQLARQNIIQGALRTEQASADNLISNLKKQGKSLQRELDRRQRQARSLDAELDKIVEEEMRLAQERQRKEQEEARRKARAEEEAKAKAEAEARRKEKEQKHRQEQKLSATPAPVKPSQSAAPSVSERKDSQQQPAVRPETGTKPADNTAASSAAAPGRPRQEKKTFESEAEADRRLTGSFASNKGHLLFPVAGKYTIVSNFGTNELPELSKVKVDNLGIDIEVPRGVNARSVFEGTVSSIFRLDGYNNIIIVRHGEYLSVYAGIDALSVKKGDRVKAGQTLGTVSASKDDDSSRLHFEIRHEKQKLNPAEWVR